MNRIYAFFALWFSLGALVWLMAPMPTATADACVVSTAADSGTGSLRDKIGDSSCDTITFGGDYTIRLASTLTITRNLTIDGTGHNVTLNGDTTGDGSRDVTVLAVNTSMIAAIKSITVTEGAGNTGGGLANWGKTTVDQVTFIHNFGGTYGGGIYNSGVLTVTESTFTRNDTTYEGGALANYSGTTVVSGSTFAANTSSQHGAGVVVWNGIISVTNSTFSGNTSRFEGGAVLVIFGGFTGTHLTFSGNSAETGAGIRNTGGTAAVANSIFVNSSSGSNCYGSVTGTNNLSDDGGCSSSTTPASSILLGSLGDYGGNTQTLPLLPGSVALDGASSACPATDQRGNARSTTCDIGAFESTGFTLAVSSGNDQSMLVNTPFASPLVVSVTANTTGDPVDGGAVTFLGPSTGASTEPITNTATVASGAASPIVSANGTVGGPYTVTASALGANSVDFNLTNECWSSITVGNANDSGVGSLRWAMAGICSAGTIGFNGDYSIPLSSTLAIGTSMTIDGVGHRVAISGDSNGDGTGDVRILYLNGYLTATLRNLTLTGGSGAGAALYVYNGTVTATNVTFSNNHAYSSAGGAVLSNYGSVTVSNSTFSGNTASSYGGAIYASRTEVHITSSTFVSNSATTSGGALYQTGSGYTRALANNIFVKGAAGANCAGSWTSSTNNLADDTSCGTETTAASAILLGSLGNYGGSTSTYPLLPGSAAIDGTSSDCPSTDQRGYARGTTCDIGAFESAGFVLAITGGDGSSASINTTFTNTLSLTVTPQRSGEPVDGGVITFAGPSTGASTEPITNTVTVASGAVATWVVANGTAGGPYVVTASTTGAPSVSFRLTNLSCLSKVTVTNGNDSGVSSLREAMTGVCANGTIAFAGHYTVQLSSALTISKNMTIDGAGYRVTISGDTDGNGTGDVQVFGVSSGVVATLQNLTVTKGNTAGNGGGVGNGGTLTVINSTFAYNAALLGGAIHSLDGALTVRNSTFVGNSATNVGGAIYSDQDTTSVTHSTFSGNTATTAGAMGTLRGTTSIANSLVAKGTTGANCSLSGTIVATNNLADDTSCGAGFSYSSTMLLGALGNYGGSSSTFPLLPGSAAINATSVNCPTTDQRGITRSSPTCDIGAFESGGFTLAISSGNRQMAFVNEPFPAPLRMTITAKTSGEPVDGGLVTFTPPSSAASAVITGSPATITGNSASVTATANSLVGGPYPVTMSAAGASNVSFELTNAQAGATVTVVSTPNPSTYGRVVTLTVTVSGTAGTPTGTVNLYEQLGSGATATRRIVAKDVTAAKATAKIVKGTATKNALEVATTAYTYTTSSLAAGTHSFVAVYSGDTNYSSSVSAPYTQTVKQAPVIKYYFPWVAK